uniref:diacylglycerol O-acyltransferase n=1 Tax=Acrobeloides nanus TaxID=290746 RepID=A0A914CZ44_9BILA
MVNWAPVNIPLARRLQTLAVLWYIIVFIVEPFLVMWLSVVLVFTPLVPFVILYYVWYFYDKDTPKKGGRPNQWYRSLGFFKYYVDYFPISLVKTTELPPENNYIIGSHPHGIFCLGAFANFATEATGFSVKFPGIKPLIVTLPSQFYFALKREINLAHGAISSYAESIENALNGSKKGTAICIVVGGAEEALNARPDNYDLKLATRKGFVKLAIRNGAWLVPMYNFGENNAYGQVDNHPGTRLRKFQDSFKKFFGFSPPLFFGRGIFQYSFGLMPYRTPITTVSKWLFFLTKQ